MTAADHLNQIQFDGPHDNGLLGARHPEHGMVGEMSWDPHSGELQNIEVHPDFQRKGLATAMWHHAQTTRAAKPVHSSQRTDAGDRWAKKVGGELPPLRKVT